MFLTGPPRRHHRSDSCPPQRLTKKTHHGDTETTEKLYGVMSYAVTQRTQEIGIRMALGAKYADIVKMVVRQGMVLAVIAVVLGLGLALGLAQLIERLLFQVSASDPPTFSVVPLILAAVALLAGDCQVEIALGDPPIPNQELAELHTFHDSA